MALIRHNSGGCSYSWLRHKDRNCKPSAKAEDERKTSGEGKKNSARVGGWARYFRRRSLDGAAANKKKNVNNLYRMCCTKITSTTNEKKGGKQPKKQQKKN